MRKQEMVILGVILLLLTSIFAMSDDGGKDPNIVTKEVKKQETKQAIIIDKSDPANFKFETENITVHRDSNGFAVDENGRVLVPVDRIV
ncbi:MAG: hypothetical protein PF574_10090 [Candidatus Delongbacteria bacterium]|jgi:alanine dehydrogenase|nr:hypothetical protein [Candidatus Delongbacteria bacterium]